MKCFSRKLERALEQVVILGAGFDSRSLRFSDALRAARVFEVDMPEVLALRTEHLLGGRPTASSAIAVPIDFEREDLGDVLRERGYAPEAQTLFLWEGVTYYLPEEAVKASPPRSSRRKADRAAASCSTM